MAIKRTIILDLKTEEAQDNVQDLKDDIVDLGEKSKKVMDETADSVESVGDSASKSKRGLNVLKKGFKGIGLAIKAAGIGLVIGLFVILKDILGKNQIVMDAVNTVMTTISLTFNAVLSAITDTYKSVNEVTGGFAAFGATLVAVMKLAMTPMRFSFLQMHATILAVQLAWASSFLGKGIDATKISKLLVSLVIVKNKIADLGLSIVENGKIIFKNFREATKEIDAFFSEMAKNLAEINFKRIKEQAKGIVDLKKQALIAAAINRGLLEDFDRQAEVQRQIRDDVNKSLDERQKANDKLNLILKQQEEQMLKNAAISIKAARNEVLINDTIENQVALIEALNEKKAILAQIEGKRSEQIVNRTALENEQIALAETITNAEIVRDKARRDADVELLYREELIIESQWNNLEIEKEIESLRLQNIIDSTKAGTQARVDSEQAKLDAITRFSIEEDKLRKDTLDREIILQKQKLDVIAGAFGNVMDILGQNSVAGKAAAVAQALVNTYAGITEVWKTPSTLLEPFATIARLASTATVAASGFAAVKAIKAVDIPLGGGGAGIGGGGSPLSVASLAPTFNVVGTGGNNQLAQTIANDNQKPIKAFVVSTEMTSQQELDRNTETDASF